jgi:hypothetical protein
MYNLHRFTEQQKKMILEGAGSSPRVQAMAGGAPSADTKAILECLNDGFARLERTLERVAAPTLRAAE